MKIGLLPVDGHNFPNLALMKLSTWHKSKEDQVEFANPMFGDYDIVYQSKVFTFSPDNFNYWKNAKVIKAGTGYRDYTTILPEHIEHLCPDYDLFKTEHAYGFLTRGCFRQCPWCVVPEKEGKTRPASHIEEFLGNKKSAVLLDNNVLAHDFGLSQIEKIIKLKIRVDFNQGLDARKIADDTYILDLLSNVKWIDSIRMACDTLSQLPYVIKSIEGLTQRGIRAKKIFVYVLIRDIEESLCILSTLRSLGVSPFGQPYRDFENKVKPTQTQKDIARWCNHKAMFKTVDFKDYKRIKL